MQRERFCNGSIRLEIIDLLSTGKDQKNLIQVWLKWIRPDLIPLHLSSIAGGIEKVALTSVQRTPQVCEHNLKFIPKRTP